jgi:uncharacterized protein YjcR
MVMRKRSRAKLREAARQMYLTGEISTNAEIASRLGVKPHTVGRWRKDEDWDGLRLKIDVRAGELFIEKIATERVSLNVRHYRFWDVLLARLADDLKEKKNLDVRELDKIATIMDRVQKGQRLAKGLSTGGETEEAIRAQAQADVRRLVDAFIEAVKENVTDENARDRIRRAILGALPKEESTGTGKSRDPVVQ